jgi:hypothetical protein
LHLDHPPTGSLDRKKKPPGCAMATAESANPLLALPMIPRRTLGIK